MEGSKMSELLSLLSEWELNGLDKFLQSPFFNRNEALVGLLALWRKGIQSKEQAWQALFPAQAYHDHRMRLLMSDLLRLSEDYLVHQELRQRPATRQIHLMQALRQRSADDLHQFTWRKFLRKGHPGPAGPQAAMEMYLLHAEQNAWLDQRPTRTRESHLQPTLDRLDEFFIFSKLRYACIAMSNRRVLDRHSEIALLDGILQHLERVPPGENTPGIAIYYQIYLLLSAENPGPHYDQLKVLLAAHAARFDPDEARTMYAFALNHCVRSINRGQSEYLREILELYQRGLEEEILLEKGELSPWNYKNIVVAGLRLSEFTWTEAFIEGYRSRIPEAYRENAYTYNLAKLFFYRADYAKVLQLLQRVEYEDVFYNLDSKVMLLKIYFESEELEALESLIDSFRTYLRRNRDISSEHRRNYQNLIRFVRQLSRWQRGDQVTLAKIAEEIRQTDQLADANWLRAKVAALQK